MSALGLSAVIGDGCANGGYAQKTAIEMFID